MNSFDFSKKTKLYLQTLGESEWGDEEDGAFNDQVPLELFPRFYPYSTATSQGQGDYDMPQLTLHASTNPCLRTPVESANMSVIDMQSVLEIFVFGLTYAGQPGPEDISVLE